MTSTFTWLDYSEQDRRRMMDIVSLFTEPDTVDELGLGNVRDANRGSLFPRHKHHPAWRSLFRVHSLDILQLRAPSNFVHRNRTTVAESRG
jgi:hypothetical protein